MHPEPTQDLTHYMASSEHERREISPADKEVTLLIHTYVSVPHNTLQHSAHGQLHSAIQPVLPTVPLTGPLTYVHVGMHTSLCICTFFCLFWSENPLYQPVGGNTGGHMIPDRAILLVASKTPLSVYITMAYSETCSLLYCVD